MVVAGIDRALLDWINGWSDSSSDFWLLWTVGLKFWTVRLVLLALVAYMLWKGKSTRTAVILALLAWPLADGTCSLLKKTIYFPRPYITIDGLAMRGLGVGSASGTASSHAANMAAIACVMWLALGWRWGLPWAFVALVTGISRVYVGAHWPSQVLLGWAVGALAGYAVWFAGRWIIERNRPKDVSVG